MRALRLVADDLTGALDTAAQFAARERPVEVAWECDGARDAAASLVIDSGCRELAADAARLRFGRFIDTLAPAADAISLLKLDSLLRGHAGAEIAACAMRWPERPIVVAPAFPAQRRVTRGGRQFALVENTWQVVGEDLAATLTALAVPLRNMRPGDPIAAGVSLCDAETDEDLALIAAAARPSGQPPLWCGSAGLGAALAGGISRAESSVVPLDRPLFGLIGSDHPAMRQQLEVAGRFVIELGAIDDTTLAQLHARLARDGVLFATFALPAGITRADAQRSIGQRTRDLLRRLPRPATLFASGGETLRDICRALQASSLVVDGEVAAGIPTSVIEGGRYHGVRVVSKSGAFGALDMLAKLIERTAPPIERPAN